MLRNFLAFGLLVLVAGGCSSTPKSEEPAGGEVIAYAKGFFPPEKAASGASFRWMGQEGLVRLRNTHQPMTLTIRGRAPIEQLTQPPTLSLELNGQKLDQIDKAIDTIERVYRIPAAQQGD